MFFSKEDSTDLWNSAVARNLTDLQTTSPPDCCILVGTQRIHAHKTAVQLNSSLLNCAEVSLNRETRVVEVELQPDFGDQYELIEAIISSFYTGSLEISENNMTIVYKFC